MAEGRDKYRRRSAGAQRFPNVPCIFYEFSKRQKSRVGSVGDLHESTQRTHFPLEGGEMTIERNLQDKLSCTYKIHVNI